MPIPFLASALRAGRAIGARVPGRVGARARAAQRLAHSRSVNPNYGRPVDHTGTTALQRSEIARENRLRLQERHAAFSARIGSVMDAVDSMFPTTAHTITVHVKGGPRADLRRVWFLAVSACMGRFKDHGMPAIRGQAINAEWDVTGKECTISLAYTVTGFIPNMVANRAPAATFGGAPRPANGVQLLMRGPDQVTVGAGWPNTLAGKDVISFDTTTEAPKGPYAVPAPSVWGVERVQGVENTPVLFSGNGDTDLSDPLRELVQVGPVLRGDPTTAFVSLRSFGPNNAKGRADYRIALTTKPPALPDSGRIITTGEKGDRRVQGPKPPLDGISRVSLVDMIAAALTSPGYSVVPTFPVAPNLADQPLGSSGVSGITTATSLPGGQFQRYPGAPVDITGG